MADSTEAPSTEAGEAGLLLWLWRVVHVATLLGFLAGALGHLSLMPHPGSWPEFVVLVCWACLVGSTSLIVRLGSALERFSAAIAVIAGLQHVSIVGLPFVRRSTHVMELQSALGSRLSATSYDLPLAGILAMLGVLAMGPLLHQATASLLPSNLTGRTHVAYTLAATCVLLGAGVVLLYATGSPWPFTL